MSTAEAVWPTNQQPDKDQIVRMYRLAYMLNPAILSREDVVDFGIDLYRLKECGEVRMSQPLVKLRKLVPGLWKRMDPHQRAAFILSYLVGTMARLEAQVKDLEKEMGDLKEIHESLIWMNSVLLGKFPKALQGKLRQGLERWGK